MNFNTLIDATLYFSDKKNCIDYLLKLRWENGVHCTSCGSNEVYKLPCRHGYHKCRDCDKMFSAVKGSIFEKSQIPLQKWFLAIYIMSSHKKGISSVQLSKDLGVTQKSAWFMLHRIRHAMKSKNFEKINGIAALDETYIGGKNRNRIGVKKVTGTQGRSTKTKMPVVAIVQPNGLVIAKVMPNTKAESIKPFIDEKIEKGSLIVTDEYPVYNYLKNDYIHVQILHKEAEFARGGFTTNSVESFFAALKRGLYGIYHKVSRQHLQAYCDEFCYRYSTRERSDGDRFDMTMRRMNCRITYDALKARKELVAGLNLDEPETQN